MGNNQKLSWRQMPGLSSNYFGREDLDDGQGGYTNKKQLTIKEFKTEKIYNTHSVEVQTVIYWAEMEKPLILNKTNSAILERITGSRYPDDWVGNKVELYFDDSVQMGRKRVGGVRITPKLVSGKQVKCSNCNKIIKGNNKITANQIINLSKRTYGKALCLECSYKAQQAAKEEKNNDEAK